MKGEFSGILRDNTNAPERVSSLETQAEQLLAMLKGDLSLNADIIDKGYADRITHLKDQAQNCQTKIIKSEHTREIRSGSLASRKGRNKSESSKLSETLTVCEKLVEIENALKVPKDNLIERAELFVRVTKLLEYFDLTRLENLKLVRAYSRKLLQITPISEINSKWLELVKINENEIECPAAIEETVTAARIIEKLPYFLDKIYTGFNDFVKCDYCLSFADGCLAKKNLHRSVGETNDSLKAVAEFIKHLDNIGLSPQPATATKLLDSIIIAFLKRAIPSNESETSGINKAISITLSLKTILKVDFKEVHQFSDSLPKLINKSKVAKTLEKARSIIIDNSPKLFDEVRPANNTCSDMSVATIKPDSQSNKSEFLDDKGEELGYNSALPISRRCDRLWSLMQGNPSAASMICILYVTIMKSQYKIRLQAGFASACLFHSDLQFLIGGLSKLTRLNKFTADEKCKNVATIPILQNTARSTIDHHLREIQSKMDSEQDGALSKIRGMENSYVFDEVAKSVKSSVTTINLKLADMQKYLPETQTKPFAAILSKHLSTQIFSAVTALEDIPSDLCTPLDNLLVLYAQMPSYRETEIEDLRFMLRSSLMEITAAYQNKEIGLDSSVVRSLIRALFSSTEHRQAALAKIF